MRTWDSFCECVQGKGRHDKKKREKKDAQKTREREERERERDDFLVLCDHEEDGDGWDDREE